MTLSIHDDMVNLNSIFSLNFFIPAIFLIDAVETIYLWFGWWPDDEEGTEASNSRRRRWDEERRKAMESAVSYANGKTRIKIRHNKERNAESPDCTRLCGTCAQWDHQKDFMVHVRNGTIKKI